MMIESIRDQFPLLAGRSQRDQIVYLDNAATTQKPRVVLDGVRRYYENTNANVHRGVHTLSEEATTQFEAARETIARFLDAAESEEIVWTRGTTEAINLVAYSLIEFLKPGDEIWLTELEHHSNIVPWQFAASRAGAKIKAVPINADGELDLDYFRSQVSDRSRILAVAHVSNAIGTINPVAELARVMHEFDGLVVVDGAQAVAHAPVSVRDLNVDFYACSGHKMFGPTGIGVLYGRRSLLDKLPPWQGGGEMIEKVTLARSTFQETPFKFEAGTPNIAGAIGMGLAADYFSKLPQAELHAHEQDLLNYATSNLQQIPDIDIVGNAAQKGPLISFNLKGQHFHDVGTLLNNQGIAVRTGHHCAMPLMDALGIQGTVRMSMALYNSRADVDQLVEAVSKAQSLLAE